MQRRVRTGMFRRIIGNYLVRLFFKFLIGFSLVIFLFWLGSYDFSTRGLFYSFIIIIASIIGAVGIPIIDMLLEQAEKNKSKISY